MYCAYVTRIHNLRKHTNADRLLCGECFGNTVIVDLGTDPEKLAENFYDGPDPVGHTHVREGVVCRIVNRPKFAAYKHKNFAFKALEGLIKDTAAAPDMEEAQDVGEQNG